MPAGTPAGRPSEVVRPAAGGAVVPAAAAVPESGLGVGACHPPGGGPAPFGQALGARRVAVRGDRRRHRRRTGPSVAGPRAAKARRRRRAPSRRDGLPGLRAAAAAAAAEGAPATAGRRIGGGRSRRRTGGRERRSRLPRGPRRPPRRSGPFGRESRPRGSPSPGDAVAAGEVDGGAEGGSATARHRPHGRQRTAGERGAGLRLGSRGPVPAAPRRPPSASPAAGTCRLSARRCRGDARGACGCGGGRCAPSSAGRHAARPARCPRSGCGRPGDPAPTRCRRPVRDTAAAGRGRRNPPATPRPGSWAAGGAAGTPELGQRRLGAATPGSATRPLPADHELGGDDDLGDRCRLRRPAGPAERRSRPAARGARRRTDPSGTGPACRRIRERRAAC